MSSAQLLDSAVPAHAAGSDLVVEPAPSAAYPFVLSSWIRSYQAMMPSHAKVYGMGRWEWVAYCATRLLASRATLLIARVSGYPDAWLGFVAAHPGMLHYVYVKHEARRRAVATALVGQVLSQCGPVRRLTHRPRKPFRTQCEALGWRYEPLTKVELENLST